MSPPGRRTRPPVPEVGGQQEAAAGGLRRRFTPGRGQVRGYHEPFLGSGAVFFHLAAPAPAPPARPVRQQRRADHRLHRRPRRASRRSSPSCSGTSAGTPRSTSTRCATSGRPTCPATRPGRPRFIYLNKTCFNGLYRVNSRGLFNVPMGRYANPGIFDPEALRAGQRRPCAGTELARRPLHRGARARASAGDFVYFDPPYVPLSRTAYFTAYTEGGFGPRTSGHLADGLPRAGHARLPGDAVEQRHARWCASCTSGFDIVDVKARRSINSKSDRRGPITEVVVLNYDLVDRRAALARHRLQHRPPAKAAKVGEARHAGLPVEVVGIDERRADARRLRPADVGLHASRRP